MSAKVHCNSPISRTIRRQCRPRFSFFCIKLSKNRQSLNRQKSQSAHQARCQPPNPKVKSLSAPRLRCRASRSVKPTCQPLFSKKITNLQVVLFFQHQQDFHPANAAGLIKSDIAVQPAQPTQGTHQSAASSVAAVVVAPYRPHQPKLSTTNHNFFQKFFPQPRNAVRYSGSYSRAPSSLENNTHGP